MSRTGLRLFPLAVLLALVGCSETPPEHPHIVLLSLDTTRADFLDFVDSETAPNLSALAERGTIFSQAIAGSSWTLPSHAQMFTGQPPALHGTQKDDLAIDPLTPTLATTLDDSGYLCAGYFSAWYLAEPYGFDRGFLEYKNSMSDVQSAQLALVNALGSGGTLEQRVEQFQKDSIGRAEVTSAFVVDNALTAIGHPGKQPLFVFGHFFDPHYDFVPPAPFDRAFDPEYAGSMTGEGFYHNPLVYDESRTPARVISDRDLEHILALYRGEIAWTDAQIGRLLKALDDSGRLDDTLIIVTSDHGEEFFEHDGRGHRATLFDEVLRVPLLIVPPKGSQAAPRCDDLVSLSDLMPTILDYAGVPAPASVDGISLRPRIESRGTQEDRALHSSLWTSRKQTDGSVTEWMIESLRTNEEKLVRTVRLGVDGSATLDQVAWYDLVNDPGETRPTLDRSAPALIEMWSRMERETARLRDRWRDLPRTDARNRSTAAPELFHSELVALGYAGAGKASGTAPVRWVTEPLPPLTLD